MARRGRHSERLGRTFEKSVVEEETDFGVTPVLFKVPTDRAGNGDAKRGGTWLDYAGCLPGARFLTFDAKWVTGADRVQRSILKPNQRAWADQALSTGAVVFVYVGTYDGGIRRYLAPWCQLREVGSMMLTELIEVDSWPEGVGEVIRIQDGALHES